MKFLEQVGFCCKTKTEKMKCVSHMFGSVYQCMVKEAFCPSRQSLALWEGNENTSEHEWGSIYPHQIFVAVCIEGMSGYRLGTVLDNYSWDELLNYKGVFSEIILKKYSRTCLLQHIKSRIWHTV